ncbi:MAG: hypothetical protein LAT84_05075 [Balneolia bacterium]|nr:hypothetical protein [Balneolia bacterium]
MNYITTITSLIIALLLVALAPGQSAAQSDATRANLDNLVRGGAVITSPIRSFGVDGTPHFNDSWLMTDVTLSNGQVLENVPAKYNSYIDALEIINRADTLQLSEVLVRGFEMTMPGGQTVKFRNRIANTRDFDQNAYLQVLFEGEQSGVFKRHRKVVREARASGSGYGVTERAATVEPRETLFFRTPEGEFEQVRLRERNVLRLFGDHRSEMRDFARSENLDFRRETDFVIMVEHFDSILRSS